MRLTATLALLSLAGPALAGPPDDDARAALALACSLRAPANPGVCPCSLTGTCSCTPDSHCGCLTSDQYRWLATSNPQQTALYRGRQQLGNYRHNEGAYYRLIEGDTGDVWVRDTCPVQAPACQATHTSGYTPTPTAMPIYQPVYRPAPWSFRSAPVYRGGGGGRACST